jgi:hypothetical protein
MKLNFWESFAFNTAIGALESLASLSTKLTPEQVADITAALGAIQKVESDFSA